MAIWTKLALCAAIVVSTAATASAATKKQKTTAHRHRRWYPWLQSNARALLTKKAVCKRNFLMFAAPPGSQKELRGPFTTHAGHKGTSLTFTTPRCQQFEQVSGTRIARARCHARGRRSARPIARAARSTGTHRPQLESTRTDCVSLEEVALWPEIPWTLRGRIRNKQLIGCAR
jgi:hypothetical protein